MENNIATATSAYHQVAYITTDFDRALATLGAAHGIPKWLELRNLFYPTGPDKKANSHVALANVGPFEFEIIAPLGGDVSTYTDCFAPGPGFKLQFHHLARHYATLEALEAELASWRRAGRKIPIDGLDPNGVRYFYGDFRAELGHHLECIYFPPAVAAGMKQAIPRYGISA